jgi:undecaprenyl diphosphate synthase
MHIAIIMDGNGRWAARRHLPRSAGHRAGARAVNAVVEAAARHGITTLTLYAFSAANWSRPGAEVSALFALLQRHLLTQTQRCLDQSIRINVIGRRDRLPPGLRQLIERSEQATAHCRGMCLRLQSEPGIDRRRFAERLADVDQATAPAPEVDLLIRTGGEQRLSDFLLWECAYAELYFVACLWPDFDHQAFQHALEEYGQRDRRFGRIVAATVARANHG